MRGPRLGEPSEENLAKSGSSSLRVAALHDDSVIAGPR